MLHSLCFNIGHHNFKTNKHILVQTVEYWKYIKAFLDDNHVSDKIKKNADQFSLELMLMMEVFDKAAMTHGNLTSGTAFE